MSFGDLLKPMSSLAGKTKLKLEGHLDRSDGGRVEGWVIDMDNPQSRLVLEVYCGDVKVGTCISDRHRKDLADKGFGDGRCGFQFNMPPAVTPPRAKEVRIFIQNTRHMFVPGQTRPREFRISEEAYAVLSRRPSLEGSKRFRKCVLHIGVEKTGTTSLQSFLSLNRDNIALKGFFIPKKLSLRQKIGDCNHIRLAGVALHESRFDEDLRGPEGVTDVVTLQAFRAAVYCDLEDEISTAPACCDTLLLSNEHCHSRLQSVEEVGFLKLWLDRYCDSYQIVVYLRPQHEVAASQYGMMLLSGLFNIDMFPPLDAANDSEKKRYTNRAYFDYDELLIRWATVFGHNALEPRIYSKDDLRNGSIVEDFCWERIPMDGQVLPERENMNVSATAQKFLLILNQVLTQDNRGANSSGGQKLRNSIRDLFPGKGKLPARNDAITFLNQFRKSNENVRTQWFPERESLFNVDFSKYPESADETELTVHEATAIFLKISRPLA